MDKKFKEVQEKLIPTKINNIPYSVNSYITANICDRACENQPCEYKKSPIFSVFTVS